MKVFHIGNKEQFYIEMYFIVIDSFFIIITLLYYQQIYTYMLYTLHKAHYFDSYSLGKKMGGYFKYLSTLQMHY